MIYHLDFWTYLDEEADLACMRKFLRPKRTWDKTVYRVGDSKGHTLPQHCPLPHGEAAREGAEQPVGDFEEQPWTQEGQGQGLEGICNKCCPVDHLSTWTLD